MCIGVECWKLCIIDLRSFECLLAELPIMPVVERSFDSNGLRQNLDKQECAQVIFR